MRITCPNSFWREYLYYCISSSSLLLPSPLSLLFFSVSFSFSLLFFSLPFFRFFTIALTLSPFQSYTNGTVTVQNTQISDFLVVDPGRGEGREGDI
jgi:hypothetical protein